MTEFYKVTGEKMSRYQKIRNVLLTVIVTLALQCTFEVCLGVRGFESCQWAE